MPNNGLETLKESLLCELWRHILQSISGLDSDTRRTEFLTVSVSHPWRSSCRATPSMAWWSPRLRCWWGWRGGGGGWGPSPGPGRSWLLSSLLWWHRARWCCDQYLESDDAGRGVSLGSGLYLMMLVCRCQQSHAMAGHWHWGSVWGQEAASIHL